MLALPHRGSHILALLSGITGVVVGAATAKIAYPPLNILLASSETVIGQAISYPQGEAKVTAAIVSMRPGQVTDWHRHDAPLFAFVLEGEVTVDYEALGLRTYRTGDSLLEAFRTYHNGRNSGDKTNRILVVFMGAKGVKNTTMRSN